MTFHFKVQHAIYDIIFFLSAFIFANRTLSQPERFQFSPSKVAVKKTNKKLVFWKVKLSFNAFFALNCFEILLEALRITHNMIPQPVEVWCHHCTETRLSATQEMHHTFKI